MSNLFVPQDHHFRQAKKLKYVARSAFKLLEIQHKHHVIKQKGARVLDLGCAPGAWLQVACQMLGRIHNGGLIVGVDIQKMRVPSRYTDARVRFLQADVFGILPWHLRQISPRVENGYTTVLSDMCPHMSGIIDLDVSWSLALSERAAQLAVGKSNFSLSDALVDRAEPVVRSRSNPPGRSKEDLAVGGNGRAESRLQASGAGIGRSGTSLETIGRPEVGSPDADVGASDENAGPYEDSVPVHKDGGLLVKGGNLVVKLLEGTGTKDFVQQCKKLFGHVALLRPEATRSTSREIYLIAKKRL